MPLMTMPSDAAVLAWARLVRAHRTALAAVEAAIKAAGHPPLEWYDVLLELERAGPLRPRDLQARLLLAQSNLSRLLDRMGKAGVVESRLCDDDRRGQLVSVTDAGRALRRRMWPAYGAAIAAAVGSKLTDAEAESVATLLGRIGSGAGTSPAGKVPSSANGPQAASEGGSRTGTGG